MFWPHKTGEPYIALVDDPLTRLIYDKETKHYVPHPDQWLKETVTKSIMNLPQNITDRYTNNLLRNGVNNDFRVMGLTVHSSTVGDHHVGFYYKAVLQLQRDQLPSNEAYGATPSEALSRCLTNFGVTYATS